VYLHLVEAVLPSGFWPAALRLVGCDEVLLLILHLIENGKEVCNSRERRGRIARKCARERKASRNM
jgi:hypothetical protein